MTQPEPILSPAYTLAIFLSVPAGLIQSLRFDFRETWQIIAVGMLPALAVVLIAYIHTKHRARRKKQP
jgi:predicted MFS family arabinose efflux permease